jgi:hypothetical protein
VSLLLSCPVADRQAASERPSLRTASPAVGVLARVGKARACHGVRRRSVSTIGCPPIRFRCPAPVVQPSGVRSSDWVVRDPAVRPTGVHPSVRSPLSRPGQPRGGLGTTSVRRVTFTTRTDRDARGLRCPSSSVDGPSRPEGATRRRSRRRAGERRSRSWAGVLGRKLRPRSTPTGQGPARREGRPSLPATPRHGSAGCSVRFLHLRVAASVAWDPRLRCVVVVEPDDRVDGPGRVNELDGADEARPQRGPARK